MVDYPAATVLCDANFSCIPLALTLLERGHRLLVCGNLISDPCHRYAHSSLAVDYADEALLLDTVRQVGARHVVAGCNDRSYLSCAYVAEQLDLPGYDPYETVLQLQEKDRFRTFATRQRFPIPQYFGNQDVSKEIQFPVLVKPTDAFSGRGISKVFNAATLPQALQNARAFSCSGGAVVEAFVEGSLHSHSAFIRGGRIVLDFFVDEFCTVYKYQVNSSCLSVLLDERIRQHIRDCIEQIVSELKLCDGLIHTQFIAKDESFWLIELTRRCPGDLYSHLIRCATGIDYAALYINGFLGGSVPENIEAGPVRHIGRHTVSADRSGYIFGMNHNIPAKHVQVLPLKNCGSLLNPAPFDKAAIFFAEFNSEHEMALVTPKLKTFITLDLLPLDENLTSLPSLPPIHSGLQS